MRPGESVSDFVARAMRAGDGRFPTGLHRHPTVQAAYVNSRGPNDPIVSCCRPEATITAPGDVAMCTVCGQWFAAAVDTDTGELYVTIIGPYTAAMRAREPMDPEDIYAAFDRAAEWMERT